MRAAQTIARDASRAAGFVLLVASIACGVAPETHEAPPTPFVLEETLRIGEGEEREEYQFALVRDVVELSDGSVVVLDVSRSDASVRRFDARGRFLNRIGHVGHGPGEYQYPYALALTPEGDVALWDPRVRRVFVYTPTGDFVGGFRAQTGLHSAQNFQVDSRGRFYVLTWETDPNDPLSNRELAYLVYTPEGDPAGRVSMPRVGRKKRDFVLRGVSPPFRTTTLSAITKAGEVVYGRNDAYRLTYERDGAEVASVELPFEPIPLEPEELTEWQALRVHSNRQELSITDPKARIPEGNEYPPIPAWKPAFMAIRPGDDGTVWVRPYAPASKRSLPPTVSEDRPRLSWYQPKRLDIFERDRLLGSVTLPDDLRALALHRNYVWGVQEGADGNPVVVRFAVRRVAGAAGESAASPR